MITILFSKKHNDNSHKLSMKLNSEKFGFFFCRKNTRINVIFFLFENVVKEYIILL